jgi:tetratricopeptide (TPR) repeat protein
MRLFHKTALWAACFGMLAGSSHGQESSAQMQVIKVEMARSRDLRRTAHRLRIGIEQLTHARTALREATDLALRQDPPAVSDYSSIARLWVQLDRRDAQAMIASLIGDLCDAAQAAEDLASYRKCTTLALQLLSMLVDLDSEKARQIAELWPPPAVKLGDAGQQALAQFQNDFNTRLASQRAFATNDQVIEQYLQPEKSYALPFNSRINMALILVDANQKEKALKLLDQAVSDLGKRSPDPTKNSDIETFLNGLANFYPERFPEAFDSYKVLLSRQDPNANAGMIYQRGDEKVLLNPTEVAVVNMIRNIYAKPELTLKLLESNPGLKTKFDRLGGLDNFLRPGILSSTLSGSPPMLSYPANAAPPTTVATSPGSTVSVSSNSADPDKSVNAAEFLRTLRGKATSNPEAVRRRLMDTCQKKEHFSALMMLAQSASYQDPDLSSIALEVARTLLPLFDNLQQRASSLRNLVTTQRQIDGEVDPTLLREGFILATEMREEEKNREQSASPPPPGVTLFHPSDDIEVFLLAQNALDDFGTALSRVHSIAEESVRIKALLQIAQTMSSYY